MITLSENFRALFYTPFYAAHAIGAYAAERVEVALRELPDPSRTAADLRAGRVDVMWGGPLRVLLTHAADSCLRDRLFLRCRRARSLLHCRPGAAAEFPPARSGRSTLRLGLLAEVPTPWLCLQDDLRRDGTDPAMLNRTHGPSMPDNAAALRAGRLDAVQLFQPYAEELLQSGTSYYVRSGKSRPHRLHDAGHPAVGSSLIC